MINSINSNDKTQSQKITSENDSNLVSNTSPQNFEDIKVDEYKGINSKIKKSILFKLQTVDINNEYQNEENKLLEDFLKKKKEKLTNNRISAKKCRMKKKAYIASLENKIQELKMELEFDNNQNNNKNEVQYSLKEFLIKTLPKKLAFLSHILFNNNISLQTKENIDKFIDNIDNMKEQIIKTSHKFMDNNLTFLINIYLEQVKILLKGFSLFYNENDKLFAMNNTCATLCFHANN